MTIGGRMHNQAINMVVDFKQGIPHTDTCYKLRRTPDSDGNLVLSGGATRRFAETTNPRKKLRRQISKSCLVKFPTWSPSGPPIRDKSLADKSLHIYIYIYI